MGLKLFGVGGIDQKSNNLLRDPKNLLGSRNVMANIEDEYVKRPGTEEDENFSGNYSDANFIKSTGEYFYRDGSNYKTKSQDSGLIKTPFLWRDDPTNDPTSNISIAEYLNTAIFTHENKPNYTAKYDGRSIYSAGLPTPKITVTAGTTHYLLTFFDFVDAQGNQIFGPATITRVGSASPTVTYETLPLPFYNGGLIIDASPAVTIDSSNRTITTVNRSLDFDHTNNFCVGTKIPIRETQVIPNVFSIIMSDSAYPDVDFGDYTLMLEIESITATTITFTADSIGTKSIVITSLGSADNILGSYKIRAFISTSETTGYVGLPSKNCQIVNNANPTGVFDVPASIVLNDIGILLSDIYDITNSKLRPPKCKYIYTYGYQIVCAPALSFWDFDNREITYTNNDLVMYSDTSTGDLGENFSEINRQLIGNTYDGEITGMTRVKDSMLIFKTRSPYALDGVLIPGQYTMRKIETNEIGCTSSKSILSIDNGVIFQAQDGLYGIDGYKCEKITNSLDKFFRDIDPKLTRSVMNTDMDKYIFWTDKGIVVYDYHYKLWYIWDSIDGSKGLTVDNVGSLRFFGPTLATKFQTALNDYGLAINAYIRSAWLDLGEPGLLKKATFLRLYSFNNTGQSVLLKYYQDWSESKFKGPFTIDMTTEKTVKRNLDIIQNQSFSFEFRNNVIDEDLNISGYEVSTAIIQERDKNVK